MRALSQQRGVVCSTSARLGPLLPVRRVPVVRAGSVSAAATRSYDGSPTSSGCFALETMSEDGQGWVAEELGQKLVGLKHRTPRASCRTTSLLSYRGDLSEGDKAARCENLNLDLTWEATAREAEGQTFTGHAKVTMHNVENHDVVDMEVAVDPACLAALPGQRERLVADVVYAVESLDTAIMEQLNDFLWSMEQRNVYGHVESPGQSEQEGQDEAGQMTSGASEWKRA